MLGKGITRKDAIEKVTGKAKYINDYTTSNMLHGALVISPLGHAKIVKIDAARARKVQGVRAVIAGERFPLVGEEMKDRPPIAVDKVRYHGEVVAVVVADTFMIAKHAAKLINIQYDPLPVVNSPSEAMQEDAPIIHENLGSYEKIPAVYPVPGTNIASLQKIRKGNIEEGWNQSDLTVEGSFYLKPSDHAAMETRCASAEIKPDGKIIISTTSQAPFMVKKLISNYFNEELGKIIVKTPLVGGGYGGKASTQVEILAYLASKAVGGRPVKIRYSREQDMLTAPCHIGLEAKVKTRLYKRRKADCCGNYFLI